MSVLPLALVLACDSEVNIVDLAKVTAAEELFNTQVRAQTITQTVSQPLTPGTVTTELINNLHGLNYPMPDVSATGATVSYSAEPVKNLTQVITVQITAGSVTKTIDITLTYAEAQTLSDEQKVNEVAEAFSAPIRIQHLRVHLDHALSMSVTDRQLIDAALDAKLPTDLPEGVVLSFAVGAPDLATLEQDIEVIIAAGHAEPITEKIELHYAGVKLADFKARYRDKISADGATIIASAFQHNQNLPLDFALPETVTTIEMLAFHDATLPAGFVLPSRITTIGASAFAETNLPETFALPDGLTTISMGAFSTTTLPANFTIPSSVKTIEAAAFQDSVLAKGFALPSSILAISPYLFSGATLPDGFTLPMTVTRIMTAAFAEAKLPSTFVIPPLVKIIEDSVFRNAELAQDFTIPSTVTAIDFCAFFNAYIPSHFSIPFSVQTINSMSFFAAKLQDGFVIPSTARIVVAGDSSSAIDYLEGVHLPWQSEWQGGQGGRINNQNQPIPGSTVASSSHWIAPKTASKRLPSITEWPHK